MRELKAKYGSGVAVLLRVRGLEPEDLVDQVLRKAELLAGPEAGEDVFCDQILGLIGQISPGSDLLPLEPLAVQLEAVLRGMPDDLQDELVRYANGPLGQVSDLSPEVRAAWRTLFETGSAKSRISPRALVVDDDPVQCKFASTIISRAGFEAEMAASRQEAIDRVSSERYELILMDYFLPDGTGADVVRTIRAGDGPSSGAYILGASIADVRSECLEAGMDEYFQKPMDVNTLKNRAQTLAAASANWQASETAKLRDLEDYRGRLQRIIDGLRPR